jgi:hypothetical protein
MAGQLREEIGVHRFADGGNWKRALRLDSSCSACGIGMVEGGGGPKPGRLARTNPPSQEIFVLVVFDHSGPR